MSDDDRDIEVIHNQEGRVIALLMRGTRYTPEAIRMLQVNTINREDHEQALRTWKEAVAAALNGQEEERRKRLEAEARADAYAQRVAHADEAMAAMIGDMFARGQKAEAIGRVMRAARDLVALSTEAARARLERMLREYDEVCDALK